MLFQKEKGLPLFGCHLNPMISLPCPRPAFALQHGNGASLCTRAANVGAEQRNPATEGRVEGWRSLQRGDFSFLQLLWDTFCFLSHALPHPPSAPGATPRARTPERSSSPYRGRVLIDVRAVGQVDEDGIHVLHICDGDCQVGQSGQRLVFILVLEKTRVWERERERISIRKIELFNSIKIFAVVAGSKFLNRPGNHLFFKLPAGIIVRCTSL